MKSKVRPSTRPRGGTTQQWTTPCQSVGLSPRGRGNHCPPCVSAGQCGSIPAWAGEPRHRHRQKQCQWVYPRVGGGTWAFTTAFRLDSGLSPRGRGNQCRPLPLSPFTRSIPAWAGEPSRCPAAWSGRRVYPRVGGGTTGTLVTSRGVVGLSPRGRGNPHFTNITGVATSSMSMLALFRNCTWS